MSDNFTQNSSLLAPKFVLKDPTALEFIPTPVHSTDAGADIRAWIPNDEAYTERINLIIKSFPFFDKQKLYVDGKLTEYKPGKLESSNKINPLEQLLECNRRVAIFFPGETQIISAGFKIQLPDLSHTDKVAVYKIVSRSGLALKSQLVVGNSPGIIDAGYRDWVGVGLYNASPYCYIISHGTRIAQGLYELVVNQSKWDPKDCLVTELDESERSGGFGSTGT